MAEQNSKMVSHKYTAAKRGAAAGWLCCCFLHAPGQPPSWPTTSPVTAASQKMTSLPLQLEMCVSHFLNESTKESPIKTVGDLKLVLIMTSRIPKKYLKDLSSGTDPEI